MKTISSLAPILVTALTAWGGGFEPTPRLLGVDGPAATVTPVLESTFLQTVSEDGRWILLASASDRLTANDRNAATDVFLVDRTTGQATLVSARPDGQSGHGTSVAACLSADATRVAWQSRAPDLVANDTNTNWDVFVRDLAAGTHHLVSQATNGGFSTGPALDPRLSEDGRYVIFRSRARDLTDNPGLPGDNLYRHDLLEGRTVCVTADLPPAAEPPWRMTGFAASSDAQTVAIVARAGTLGTTSNLVFWINLGSGRSVNCAAVLPSELSTGIGPHALDNSGPTLSANGRFVAFQTKVFMSSRGYLHGLSLYDTEVDTITLLSLRTNVSQLQTFPATDHQADLSADGRYTVYSAPWPFDPALPDGPDRTNGPSQVYLYDAQTQTTRLVSTAPDGVTPADADAIGAKIAPDGRGVMFVSRAANLAARADTATQLVYWWDRATATLAVAGELQDGSPEGRVVMSPGGAWIVTLNADPIGRPTFACFRTRDSAVESLRVNSVDEPSASGRGWIGIRPEGVSADGRYVALMAFPPAGASDTNHFQVYRLDTRTGARDLLTQGVDGALGNGHPAAPSISADGARVLYASAASNLSSEDTNLWRDAFLSDAPNFYRRWLRPAVLPSSTDHVDPAPLLSPDGRFAFLAYRESGVSLPRLADLETGGYSGNFRPDVLRVIRLSGAPVFSRDGRRLAVGLATRAGTSTFVDVYDSSAWMTAGDDPLPALWRSIDGARDPMLSADGNRLAYLHLPKTGTNAVVVIDWASNQILFTQPLDQQVPDDLAFSADGRCVAWASPGVTDPSTAQIWCAEIESGSVALVSVATDGLGEGNGRAKSTAIGPDGRYVAFSSVADNLAPDDVNGAADVFLRDRQTGRTLLVSRTPAGAPGNGWSVQPFFSADGRNLFFLSGAPDLAAGDYNQTVDLFKVEIFEGPGSDLLLAIRRNLTTGQTQLLWAGRPDRSYALEFKDRVDATAWTRLAGTFSANAPVDVDPAVSICRYFRVVELP